MKYNQSEIRNEIISIRILSQILENIQCQKLYIYILKIKLKLNLWLTATKGAKPVN